MDSNDFQSIPITFLKNMKTWHRILDMRFMICERLVAQRSNESSCHKAPAAQGPSRTGVQGRIRLRKTTARQGATLPTCNGSKEVKVLADGLRGKNRARGRGGLKAGVKPGQSDLGRTQLEIGAKIRAIKVNQG
jgi:hypothetical protein